MDDTDQQIQWLYRVLNPLPKNSIDKFYSNAQMRRAARIDIDAVVTNDDGIEFKDAHRAALRDLIYSVIKYGEGAVRQKAWIRTEADRAHKAVGELLSAIEALESLLLEEKRLSKDDFEALLRIEAYSNQLATATSGWPIKTGPNRGPIYDHLIDGLAVIFEEAGGRPGGSWGNPECTMLDGPFNRFLDRVWNVMPRKSKPTSSEAFKRRAKKRLANARETAVKLDVSRGLILAR